MSHARILLGPALFFAVALSAQTPKRAAQAPPVKAANDWMKTPMDSSSPDDAIPYVRHVRDAFWDGLIGNYGVLTPKKTVHLSGPDYGPPEGEDPEIPNLRADDAAIVGTFDHYRTALTTSGRAIYTDVTFTVGHVFRDASRGHALPGLEVTVSVPGGTVQTSAGAVSFMTDPQEFFMQPGKTYLLILYYMADGDFYVGTPSWDLSNGIVKANSYETRAKATRGLPTIVGLTKDELIRALDQRFSGKQ